jgi:hypothetical protein
LFIFKALRRANSWDYVTEAATQKTGEKASKMGILFFRKTLSFTERGHSMTNVTAEQVEAGQAV